MNAHACYFVLGFRVKLIPNAICPRHNCASAAFSQDLRTLARWVWGIVVRSQPDNRALKKLVKALLAEPKEPGRHAHRGMKSIFNVPPLKGTHASPKQQEPPGGMQNMASSWSRRNRQTSKVSVMLMSEWEGRLEQSVVHSSKSSSDWGMEPQANKANKHEGRSASCHRGLCGSKGNAHTSATETRKQSIRMNAACECTDCVPASPRLILKKEQAALSAGILQKKLL
eukprot:1160335-Pelagomonas_calceolata.AAC.16